MASIRDVLGLAQGTTITAKVQARNAEGFGTLSDAGGSALVEYVPH